MVRRGDYVQKKSVNRGAPTGQVQKEGQKLETIIFYSFSYELFFTSHFMNMYFFFNLFVDTNC